MAAKAKKPTAPGLTVVRAAPVPPFAKPETAAMPAFPAPLSYTELAAIGRDNIEAAVKANAALSAGIEAIGQEFMACARTALQSASETARGLLGAKTLEDVVKLNTDFAKRNLEGLMAGSVKLSELGCSVATEAFAPWEGRVEAVMAQFAPPAAAGEAKSAA
jgi:phasin family protein